MFTLYLLSVVSCLAGWLWLRWRRLRNHWAERGVPYITPNPLVGSLTFLQRENPITWFRRQYNIFAPAPYFGIFVFWRPALVVTSPEIARRVLVKDADNFRNRYVGAGSKSDPIGSLNIFTANDPVWTSIRRRLTPTFTAAKLRALNPLLKAKTQELLQRMKTDMERDKKIDIREIFTNFTTDVIGTSAFGVQSDATSTGHSPMRVVTRDFQAYSLWRGLSWCLIFFFPAAAKLLGCQFFPKATTNYFRKVFSMIVKQREGCEGENESKDLMDALLKIKKEGNIDGEDVSDDLLIAQAAVFIQGGFETSAVALTCTAYEMIRKPTVQENLFAELKAAKAKNNDADFDSTSLAELPYLNAVIKENLRKYPPMGWIDRISDKAYMIDDQLTIEKGTPVYICAAGLHYDPQYFSEPEEFKPERFLPENEANITPFTYMPFGEGPRNCIGIRFAYQTLRYALSALVLNYQLSEDPGAPMPSHLEIDKRGLFLSPEATLYAKITPRC